MTKLLSAFTWLAALVRHTVILDAVEDVLGPNLLVWSTSCEQRRSASHAGQSVARPAPAR